MALRGTIDTMSVADLLDWMDRRAASGTLTLTRGAVARRFAIAAGAITLGSSSEQRILLGRLLMIRGLIRPTELERALRAAREARTRLGRVLTLIGAVDESDVKDVLSEKILAMITDSLGWTDGRFVFDDAAAEDGEYPMVRIALSLRDVLAHARRQPADLADHALARIGSMT